jgi:hypothetical protein
MHPAPSRKLIRFLTAISRVKPRYHQCYKVKPCGRVLALNGRNNVGKENKTKIKTSFFYIYNGSMTKLFIVLRVTNLHCGHLHVISFLR